MNDFCNKCHKPSCVCGGCGPASYGSTFDINANPYDPSLWNVTINGETARVRIPKIAETDTTLSTNYTIGGLVYNGENHTDTVTGEQLASLINFKDLRDTDVKEADSFDLVVYHPYCDKNCGDGCTPKEAKWTKYHVPAGNDNVLEADSDGYYHVLTLTDCGGIVGGKIYKGYDDSEIRCMLSNLLKAIKPFEGEGRMIDVQSGGSTDGFTGMLNPNTGEFSISWKDWVRSTQVAHGTVSGRLNATSSFDFETGKVTYTITSIYYDKVVYTVDANSGSSTPMTTTVWGCFPGAHDLTASHDTLTRQGLKIFERTVLITSGNSYTQTIGVTYTGRYSITLNPNGTYSGWIPTMRLYNDWIADDDGIVQVRYKNPLDWENC